MITVHRDRGACRHPGIPRWSIIYANQRDGPRIPLGTSTSSGWAAHPLPAGLPIPGAAPAEPRVKVLKVLKVLKVMNMMMVMLGAKVAMRH